MEQEFKAFDKVLVRDEDIDIWCACHFYMLCVEKYMPYIMTDGYRYAQCIPYEGNEHLLGTADSPTQKEKSYKERQSECGIQVGDTVKITRKAESCEDGWDDCWSGRMDKFIGETGTVKKIDNEHGIKLEIDGETWLFPYFVLEKVEAGLQIQDVFKPQIGDVCFVWNENVQFKTIKVCSGFKNNGEPLFSFWNIEDAIPYDHYELYTGQKPEWIDK